MGRHWTFGQKLAAGFTITVTLALLICGVGLYALHSVAVAKDKVIAANALLVDAERLYGIMGEKSASAQSFLLTREERWLGEMREAHARLGANIAALRTGVRGAEPARLVEAIGTVETEHEQALDRVVALRRTDAALDAVVRVFDEQVTPRRDRLFTDVKTFIELEQRQNVETSQAAAAVASRAVVLLAIIGIVVTLFAVAVAVLLTRALGRQIGSTVGQVQSSSAELQSSANQQATGAREQATAMSQISTTISELLATSRQIAESSQRVSSIAEQTAMAARGGDGMVDKARESFASIRRQVDLIVTYMVELGKKSQQIGLVLDIVSELAEQTNILAINATIEAAGAGDTGKRFAVVADEIRKLADRVSGSAKDIRTLIEDVRGSVNTTVMATETGSKAVDAGAKQYGEVASAFKQIVGMVVTTTDAAREIELSTKQQTSAVEQVNVAIANVAQATRESEASSVQTLQTASQLTTLSRDLLRLIQQHEQQQRALPAAVA